MDSDGSVIRAFGAEGAKAPDGYGTVHGMKIDASTAPPTLWVTDSGKGRVRWYEPATGELLGSLGTKGSSIDPLEFGSVADIAFDAEGGVYISDGVCPCGLLGGAWDASVILSRDALTALTDARALPLRQVTAGSIRGL